MANLIRNNEPRALVPVRTGLEYRVHARTKREPKRVWPDKPTYKIWLGNRTDNDAHREGYQAFRRENLSQAQQDEYYRLLDRVHTLLKQRTEIDREYSKALDALAAFGSVPIGFENEQSAKVKDAIRIRKLGLRPEKE